MDPRQLKQVELYKTPEELVKSPLFAKVLGKILDPADVLYIQEIVANRLDNKEITSKEEEYLGKLEQDESRISQFNKIINTIEYINKKKGAQTADKQELPYLDDTGKADTKKIITWLRGGGKEAKEMPLNLPSPVAKQEEGAIKYFEDNKEPNNLKVIEGIQKLRAEGKITYTDLRRGKYEVTMPCGSRKLKMYFPPDEKRGDATVRYRNFKDEEIINREVKKIGGQSKLNESLLSKADFLELGESLCPNGTEEEKILAFMMATGFYGSMWLKKEDKDDISSSHPAVSCDREYRRRRIYDVSPVIDGIYGSVVRSAFIS